MAPNRLREVRKAAGLTQTALAERLGVARPAVSMWERGVREPQISSCVRVADVLDTTVDAIWGTNP